MGKIKVLDDVTVQKIAAGEVVERPASIVKELVENSLDANANSIVIEIKNGGKTYIRVTDNGDGISSSDLDMAFMKHSTSKLREIDDLYKITSLGFRGEALSSISTVSRVEVISKTNESETGIKASIEEAKLVSKDIIGSPKGTTMIVKDLFYNLPVRKDFLKTDLIESNKISDIVYKIALGNPNCSFKFIKDNKVILTTMETDNLNNHIYTILGKEFTNNLIEVNYEEKDLSIHGYISNNHLYRGNRGHQYLYINGRYIYNKEISNVIEDRYKSIIPLSRFPIFILFLDINPGKIDVNIHPTKQEVKFSNQDIILETISMIVNQGLRKDITIPKVNLKKEKKKNKSREEIPLLFKMGEKKTNIISESNNLEKNNKNTFILKDFRNNLDKDNNIYLKENNVKLYDSSEFNNLDLDYEDNHIYSSNKLDKNHIDNKNIKDTDKKIKIEETLDNLEVIGVIFSTYILAEDKVNSKFYIIDQHAAHERVMYEKYYNEFKDESINIQQLLVPEIIELTNKEINLVKENMSIFTSLGFDIDIFGNASIIIRGVPIVFGNPHIRSLFMDILDNIHLNPTSSYDLKLDKIMKIACVNSIKSGDNVKNLEIYSLISQLKKCSHPYTCPHGRPTMIEMTKTDIEKEFLRIM